MLVPRVQTLPDGSAAVVRVCRRAAADMIADCVEYATATNFIYHIPVFTGRVMAQTAAAGAGAWSVFFTLDQVCRPPLSSHHAAGVYDLFESKFPCYATQGFTGGG
jgi:hypothetical protein